MKTYRWLLLGLTLSTRAFAQPAANTNANSAPQAFPPPSALSPATLEKINHLTPIFDGKTLDGWVQAPATSWVVKAGAMASVGAGRGTICTRKSYGNYRLIFTMRHAGVQPGQSDHMPCVLIYCTAPPAGEKGLDALAGIQFQTPNGGSWDYRPGRNNSGKEFFTRVPHPRFDPREWHQVELLVNTNGTARMAVAQPVGTKAYEVLVFHDPAAGKSGPVAWQMHNKGLLDEYKDVRIEEDPAEDRLIIVE